MTELHLVEQFQTDPEAAYRELLERYSPVLLRMIRHFMEDDDEVMEVYAGICERFRASDFQVLRRYRPEGELTSWLAVVVANACRDRFRKKKASSMPMSVIEKLNTLERLVFTYHYQEHLPHEDIAEIVSRRHRMPCTALEVVQAIARINELLSTRKRWLLLSALRSNQGTVSIDELSEYGFQPSVDAKVDAFDEALQHRALLDRLQGCLDRLDPEDQLLIHFRYEHDRSAPQITRIMHFENHKQVYTRLRTIVNRLRRCMESK